MAIKVGIAAASWGIGVPGAPGEIPWDRFLDESSQAGYEWIEAGLYGYLPRDPSVARAELDKRGTGVVATTVMKGHLEAPQDWPRLEAAVLIAGEYGAALGARHLVLIDDVYTGTPTGGPSAGPVLGEDSWKRLVEGTHRVADLAIERFGLPIAFHGHTDTHVETEEQLEAFLADTDPERVSLCFDTGHHAYCGGDPVGFMRRHHDRVSYMHFKNVDGAIRERVEADGIPLETATEIGVWCELSEGTIDYAELGRVLREVEYDGWVMVEHDMRRPPPHVPLPIARRARAYLREVGIG
jgi:inosose dehydratase